MRLLGLPVFAAAAFSYNTLPNNNNNNNNNSMIASSLSRTIARVVNPKSNGPIHRLIGTVDCDGAGTLHDLPEVDPFILLDTATIAENEKPPFGAHPHRGHSVVTILLQGKVRSWDSFRASKDEQDVIKAPASYWVDAGTGLFHDEKSVVEDESDPKQHMKIFQLWIGVSEADRSKPPRVQYDTKLPSFQCKGSRTGDDEKQQVIVGEGRYYVGSETSIETPHPITVAHITQDAGTTYSVPIPPTQGGFVISMKGNALFGGTAASVENHVLVLNNDEKDAPDVLQVTTKNDNAAEYLVCFGERIEEPWAKKLVASGAVIAATAEEARELAVKVEAMSKTGKSSENGSFAPFGI